jgi:hypothetical protein
MFFCEICGQCLLLGDEDFYEMRNTWGWEKNLVSAEDGDYVEIIDSEISDSEHSSYECPCCSSDSVNNDWHGEIEEARELRRRYQESQEAARRQYELARMKTKSSDPKRNWDYANNIPGE